jgi:hypothetical protein
MLRSSGRYWWNAALAGLAGWALLTLAVPAPAGAGSQLLSLNWPSQRDSDVTVTEIELTEAQIIATLRIRNRSLRPSRPRLFPPGHPLSFYILEKATGKRHYLAGSQGLAVDPDYTSLAPGRTLTCKLFFNRIPLASFSLLEGEPSLRGTVPNSIFWDFLDIDLAKLEKNFKAADRPPPRPDHIWNQPSDQPAKPEAKSAAPVPKPAKEKEPLQFFDNPPAQKQETES